MYWCGTKKIPLEDPDNLSEISDEIIQVQWWDFFVLQQYFMMDTLSHPFCDV